MTKINVNGILLLYHHPVLASAPTIMEHVNAFSRHSKFKVWKVNTELGFPKGLNDIRFQILVLHYTLFGSYPYKLNDKFIHFIKENGSTYKIAFFQDEYRYCQQRFRFINQHNIDCVYTLLKPQYFNQVYRKYTSISKIVHTIPGYVSEDLIQLSHKMTKPNHERQIDVGYRARPLEFYMGKGGQEKTEIAYGFHEREDGLGLQLDIRTDEKARIYGRKWYQFLTKCRAVLGVESGISIFDLEDKVRLRCEEIMVKDPNISFKEISKRVLAQWENNIYYRTISPRHFEAAALKVCQILFEGEYSGIMKPLVHYIPLKKDFSNFRDVIIKFENINVRHHFTENAYRDLIVSGQYSYKKFIENFDQDLLNSGFRSDISLTAINLVTELLRLGRINRRLISMLKSLRHYPFPGKYYLSSASTSIFRK
ncbi:MAG: hypothetical protein SV375_01840 [Thermodesulfobacteriota bacterium]|nr:hypothetical protein [Thermodesulfobacteriota bacterium]